MVLLGGKAEAKAEHFLFGYVFVEQGVVLLYGLLFFLVEPAAFTGQEFRFELGVQCSCSTGVTQSMACSKLTQRKRREPVRSTSRSSRLLVPMNEAMRGSAEALRL